jgi:Ni,Fe-hydrogenase III large subunit
MSDTITIPVGPQHPLLKEPLSFSLDIAGERITDARVNVGYVHRGIERLAQDRTYAQNVAVVERICGICSHAHTTAYCQAVEGLLDLQIPPRGAYIRVLMCELERIHSHLLWLGVLAEAIGFTTIFMYTWRERDVILDILEDVSGGRIAHAANLIGGVRMDITAEQGHALLARLRACRQEMILFQDMLERDRSFHLRTEGISVVDRARAHQLGLLGPIGRASGCTYDVRRAAPYAAYPHLEFEVITATAGDVWSRAYVRVQEVLQSFDLCHQIIQALPEGPIAARVPRRVPAGEIVTRVEAPRGELIYYIRSDGSNQPARLKVRTPTLPALAALEEMLPGCETADLASVIAGADLCIACADR